MLKVNNENTKVSDVSGVFVVNFEHISHFFSVRDFEQLIVGWDTAFFLSDFFFIAQMISWNSCGYHKVLCGKTRALENGLMSGTILAIYSMQF